MSILRRTELLSLFKSKTLRIEDAEGIIDKWAESDYSWNNPFQQCSIDLSVGSIYVPGTEPYDFGGAYNPKTDEHLLKTGHTVMIRTREKITLPDNIGGICFSPSRLALKAILITNTGHVDPGYSGHLHFTAINMGKESYTFRKSDPVCSMIFFKLSEKVQPFGDEHFTKIATAKGELDIPTVITNYFPKLAKDFVDVEKRALSVAKEEINKRIILLFFVPVILALIFGALSIWQYWTNKSLEKELSQLSAKIELMEKKVDYEGRIKTLEVILSKRQKQ